MKGETNIPWVLLSDVCNPIILGGLGSEIFGWEM